MSAKKKTVQFHRTKTGFEEFDFENWCDLALAEGYDKSVQPYNEDVDMIEPNGLVLGADCCVESSFDTTGDAGEVVWSRSSGVTIVKDGNQQSRQHTEQPAGGADPTTTNLKRKKKKNKGRRKKKQFRGRSDYRVGIGYGHFQQNHLCAIQPKLINDVQKKEKEMKNDQTFRRT